MYLLIINDEGEGSKHNLKNLVYHWFHPGPHQRDLRDYLVKQVGPCGFLITENNYAMRSVNWLQSRHGKDRVVVYKIGEPVLMNDELTRPEG